MTPDRTAGIPPTLSSPDAAALWTAVLVTGIGTGLAAALLTRLLGVVQHLAWPGPNLLDAASHATPWRHVVVLIGAGALTGAGQWALHRLTGANGIDITEAITRFAGRLPVLRTLGSALLSILVVAMGASLGREGAPKQTGAVLANLAAERMRLSDEQRRLLVACGAGAGMAAAYGVPLGGAVFALEVLRGVLALRLILPALLASAIATAVSWIGLPDAPTYVIPAYPTSASVVLFALLSGPIIGLASVGYVWLVGRADRGKPQGNARFLVPVVALASIGIVSIGFPQVLGNGKDIAQLAFTGDVAPGLLLALLVLRPLATVLCLGSGVPGGLFTPSLAFGALLGGALGLVWSSVWPGVPAGLYALLGASALLAASTRGPISAVILVMELTGRDRAFILPLILVVATATVVARSIDARSIYDVRFSELEMRAQERERRPSAT